MIRQKTHGSMNTTLANGRESTEESLVGHNTEHSSSGFTDRHHRSRTAVDRWRRANKGGTRGRPRCGWRPKTYRAVPHIPIEPREPLELLLRPVDVSGQ